MDMEELKGAEIITAGFPCQDISLAGKGAGLAGERSGLWWQVRRTLRMVRPAFALLENVAALLNRGMDTVLGSLASIGYDTEWHCIPASYVGAPHRRDRIWIIAHTDKRSGETGTIRAGRKEGTITSRSRKGANLADNDGGRQPRTCAGPKEYDASICGENKEEFSNTNSQRSYREGKHKHGKSKSIDRKECKPRQVCKILAGQGNTEQRSAKKLAHPSIERIQRCGADREQVSKAHGRQEISLRDSSEERRYNRPTKPFMGGMAHGLSRELDKHFRVDPADSGKTTRLVKKDKTRIRAPRLKVLGNAIVPQVATLLGHAIADYNDELHVSEAKK